MSAFAVLLLCVQACLLQTVFGQFCGAGLYGAYDGIGYGYGPYDGIGYGLGPYDGLGYGYGMYGALGEPFAGPYGIAGPIGPLAGPLATGPCGAYGGAGIGEVAVAGELPVAGVTAVAGQVPIIGAVEFGGPVCAAGTVTMAGSCACGCAGPYGAYGAGPFGYMY